MSQRLKVVVGNKRCSVEEVALVALENAEVVLDSGKLELLSEEKDKGKTKSNAASGAALTSTVVEEAEESDFGSFTETDARAIVLVKLISVIHGRAGVPVKVMRFMSWLLNAGVIPVLPISDDDSAVLKHLTAVLQGEGQVWYHGNVTPTREALAAADSSVTAPGMTTAERNSFISHGIAVSTALAALAVYGAGALLDAADNVAGLTCEALQCNMEPFQIMHHDVPRPHQSQVQVANNLRTMLDGSKVLENVKSEAPASLAAVPQLHGPVRDVFNAASKAVRVDLNSVEGGQDAPHWMGEFHTQPLVAPLANLHTGLAVLAGASESRILGLIEAERKMNENQQQQHSYLEVSFLF